MRHWSISRSLDAGLRMWGEYVRTVGECCSRFEFLDLSFKLGFDSSGFLGISLDLDICEVGIEDWSVLRRSDLCARTCIARYWGGWYGLDPCRFELSVEVADRVAVLKLESVCFERFEASSELMVSDLLLEVSHIACLSSL